LDLPGGVRSLFGELLQDKPLRRLERTGGDHVQVGEYGENFRLFAVSRG
jgi:hypothetical protein